jgi:hypothetical protein
MWMLFLLPTISTATATQNITFERWKIKYEALHENPIVNKSHFYPKFYTFCFYGEFWCSGIL